MMDVLNASTEAFVSPFAQRREQVAAVLDDLFPTLNGTTRTLVGPGIPTGGNIGVRVHLEEAWLVLDIPLAMTQTPPASWAQIVGLQAALPACVKVVLPKNKPDGPSDLYLRADVALDAEDDPASRVATVATALPVALLLCASAGLTTRNGPMSLAQADGVAPTVQDSIDDASSLEAAKLVAEAGWNYIERSAAEGVVDLQVPGEFRQAELTVRADGIHLAAYLRASTMPLRQRRWPAFYCVPVAGCERSARRSAFRSMTIPKASRRGRASNSLSRRRCPPTS
jgi:hypothetical protein